MARYEFVEGKSSKFWEIELDGSQVTTRWGRIGSKGQAKTKDLDSPEAAQKEYDKLVKSKTKKGYQEVGAPPAAATSSALNPELEAAITTDPENPENYLVYADWLQAQGNPLGEWIGVQAGLKKDPKHKKLLAEQKTLLEKHKGDFFGPVADVVDEMIEDIEWYCGFIRHAKIKTTYERDPEFADEKTQRLAHEVLDAFLDLPIARFLQSLTLGIFKIVDNGYEQAAAVIAKRKLPTLHTLYIGDFYYEETELNWSNAGDISPIYASVPNLRTLTVRSAGIVLGDISLPELRSFTTITGGLNAAAVESVCKAKWPKLESLSLQIGAGHQGACTDVKAVAPLLAGTGLPHLKHLGITNSELVDDLCVALAGAKILPQLESLDISMGEMTRGGAESLLRIADQLAHLKRFDMSQQYNEEAFDTDTGIPWWEDQELMAKPGGLAQEVMLPDGEERYYPVYE